MSLVQLQGVPVIAYTIVLCQWYSYQPRISQLIVGPIVSLWFKPCLNPRFLGSIPSLPVNYLVSGAGHLSC